MYIEGRVRAPMSLTFKCNLDLNQTDTAKDLTIFCGCGIN